ncbi:uncharacterized protein LOC128876587 [Hylaeus volcanicus]|uniref:uncharacterized protein LOC128876587 n=1 Tax=Hylaeus volcanicus TaxID=313075 RepID=UPI0023B79387|nr:uncharacterized protein LOC128876587 [Hylaeus volcanicus]
MARSSLCIIPLCFASLVAWADGRALLAEEDERRWNTPPELIPEQVVKKSDMKNARLLSIPITANINVNAGSNAHSLGFQVGPEGFGYSESSSFNQQADSQSQSLSFVAGSSGVAGAASQAMGQHRPVLGNQGHVNGQSFGFGSAAASSSGTVQNGHAASVASSSVGSVHSSASSGAGTIAVSEGMHIRFPEGQRQPIWTNIRPNYNNNGPQGTRAPKLNINVEPQREQNFEPILQISTQQTRWGNDRRPTIRIQKWHPTYRSYYDDVHF